MMKSILASTAAAALLAGGAFAQTEPAVETAPDSEVLEQHSDDAAAGTTTAPVVADDTMAPDAEEPAMAGEDAAEPADPMMTQDAPATGDDSGADPMMTEDATETEPMATEDAAEVEPMVTEDATEAEDGAVDPMMTEGDAPAADPMMADEGMMSEDATEGAINISEVSADRLMGASITTMDGESIASVEDVIITDDGQVESLVAQFGGFLGFGSNQVLLTPDEVTLLEGEDGALMVQTNLTPESIEDRPAYEE